MAAFPLQPGVRSPLTSAVGTKLRIEVELAKREKREDNANMMKRRARMGERRRGCGRVARGMEDGSAAVGIREEWT